MARCIIWQPIRGALHDLADGQSLSSQVEQGIFVLLWEPTFLVKPVYLGVKSGSLLDLSVAHLQVMDKEGVCPPCEQ